MVAASKCSWRNAPKNGLDFPLGNFHVEKLQYITIDVHVFFATFGKLVQTVWNLCFPTEIAINCSTPPCFVCQTNVFYFHSPCFFLEIMWIPATIAGKSKILFIIQNTYSNLQLGRRKLHFPPYFVIWLCLKMGYASMPRKCHLRTETNLSHEFSSILEGFTPNVQVPKTYFSGVPTSRINSSTPTM